MYFKQSSKVMYRDYGSFGYITDNRNFEYRLANDQEESVGDKVVSESGAVFLSALSRTPQSIDVLSQKICQRFSNVDVDVIRNDAITFYSELETEGFVISGKTIQECHEKQQNLCGKKIGPIDSEKDCFSCEKIKNSTQEFFENYFNGEPQLTSLHIEIISKCNERCLHCYIPHENKTDIMDANMFYDILEQAREMNLLNVTISGGEPLAHINFVDFLKKCNEYNFSVNVLTNLTLLSQEILDEMKKNALLCVQTSLYSLDENIHDSITQQCGSCEKTKVAILKLVEKGVPVQISCPIMKQNMNCYKDVIDWGKAHNINVNSDYVLIASYNHTVENLNCRLSISEVKKLITEEVENNPNYLQLLEKEYVSKKDIGQDDYICSVCSSSICISENGNVYPCAGWQDYVVGNIEEARLRDIWNKSEEVNYLRNLKRKDFSQCIECAEKEFCTMCMVRNANEDPEGNPLKVNAFFCNIAKINRDMYFTQNSILPSKTIGGN